MEFLSLTEKALKDLKSSVKKNCQKLVLSFTDPIKIITATNSNP
jgi:hypothetical protein